MRVVHWWSFEDQCSQLHHCFLYDPNGLFLRCAFGCSAVLPVFKCTTLIPLANSCNTKVQKSCHACSHRTPQKTTGFYKVDTKVATITGSQPLCAMHGCTMPRCFVSCHFHDWINSAVAHSWLTNFQESSIMWLEERCRIARNQAPMVTHIPSPASKSRSPVTILGASLCSGSDNAMECCDSRGLLCWAVTENFSEDRRYQQWVSFCETDSASTLFRTRLRQRPTVSAVSICFVFF